MKRFASFFALAALGMILLVSACSDSSPTDSGGSTSIVPAAVVGILDDFDDQSALKMIIFWNPGSSTAVSGYNVYRKIGAGSFEKQNAELINSAPVGPEGVDQPFALYYVDESFDESSTDTYEYYVTAVSTSQTESEASRSVSCVPADLNFAEPVEGALPNQAFDVRPTPFFDWTSKAGATSYMVYLQNNATVGRGKLLWLYLHTGATTQIGLHETQGTTFFDIVGPQLITDERYFWGVWAIDANNCAFASSHPQFWTYDPLDVHTLVYEVLTVGSYEIDWVQDSARGNQVLPGAYIANMVAEFEGISRSANMVIQAPTGPPITRMQPEGNTPMPAPRLRRVSDLPGDRETWSILTDKSLYNVGEQVTISFSVQTTSQISIKIIAGSQGS